MFKKMFSRFGNYFGLWPNKKRVPGVCVFSRCFLSTPPIKLPNSSSTLTKEAPKEAPKTTEKETVLVAFRNISEFLITIEVNKKLLTIKPGGLNFLRLTKEKFRGKLTIKKPIIKPSNPALDSGYQIEYWGVIRSFIIDLEKSTRDVYRLEVNRKGEVLTPPNSVY